MRNKYLALAGMAGLAMLLSAPAHATLLCLPNLAAGGVQNPNINDTCAADLATFAASTLVSDTGVQPFTGSGVGGHQITNGTYREAVYQETSGTLDFFIQLNVNNTGSQFAAVFAADTNMFAGFNTNVGTMSSVSLLPPPAGSKAPSVDTRTLPVGDMIAWTYLNPVLQNFTSFTMAISTNATADVNCASCIGFTTTDRGVASVNGFAPSLSAVPEPVSIILLGTALALSAVVIRRRHSSKESFKA